MIEPQRLAILGNPVGYYVRDLKRAASELGDCVSVEVVNYENLSAGINLDGSVHGCVSCDALLVRTMPLGSLEQVIFRMDCLQGLHDRGVAVLNPPKCLETAIDKWLTLHRLAQAGILVPATRVCQTRASALEAYESLGRDVVVKPLFGGEGRGIVRIQTPEIAWRVFGAIEQIGGVAYVQQFVEHLGYDIRILWVGDRHFSIRRRAQDGWLTNLSLGSQAEPHAATDCELDLARRSLQAIGGSVIGVDILPALDGRYFVLEVNAVPGWRGTARALGVDLSRCVVEHAVASAAKRYGM